MSIDSDNYGEPEESEKPKYTREKVESITLGFWFLLFVAVIGSLAVGAIGRGLYLDTFRDDPLQQEIEKLETEERRLKLTKLRMQIEYENTKLQEMMKQPVKPLKPSGSMPSPWEQSFDLP